MQPLPHTLKKRTKRRTVEKKKHTQRPSRKLQNAVETCNEGSAPVVMTTPPVNVIVHSTPTITPTDVRVAIDCAEILFRLLSALFSACSSSRSSSRNYSGSGGTHTSSSFSGTSRR